MAKEATAIAMADSGQQLIHVFAALFFAKNQGHFTDEQQLAIIKTVVNDGELAERIGSEILVAFAVALRKAGLDHLIDTAPAA
jgi:hypothetical protein